MILLALLPTSEPVPETTSSLDRGQRPDRICAAFHLQLKEPLKVPALDPPYVFSSEHAITSRGRIVAWRRGPSDGYAVNFPLQEGSYAHMINQAVAAGDVDRFVISLVAHGAESRASAKCGNDWFTGL